MIPMTYEKRNHISFNDEKHFKTNKKI